MAGISNWFSFTSKEEREERSAEYFKRMFPLGAQQKTKEEELLQQLISAKTSDGDKLYQMLIVRHFSRKMRKSVWLSSKSGTAPDFFQCIRKKIRDYCTLSLRKA